MTDYVQYDTGDENTRILVEVEEGEISQQGGVQKVSNIFKSAGNTIAKVQLSLEGALEQAMQRNANAFIQSVSQLPILPSEAEFTFCLKATSEGNLSVAKVTGEGNYTVRLTWKREPTSPQADKQAIQNVQPGK